jgi:hypothetical protein
VFLAVLLSENVTSMCVLFSVASKLWLLEQSDTPAFQKEYHVVSERQISSGSMPNWPMHATNLSLLDYHIWINTNNEAYPSKCTQGMNFLNF